MARVELVLGTSISSGWTDLNCPERSRELDFQIVAIEGHGDQPERVVGLGAADVMTVSDVAEFLHIPVSTVYELTRRGELPARRVGRTWRFLRPRLEEVLWS